MKRKLILSSVMTIILALSLIAGSTLALFTSQSQVNISVSSAKVQILSVIDNASLELYSLDVLQEEKFENGGTAELTDASHLVLENVTPGDKVVFDILVSNESTVDIQYRIAWSVEGSLAGGLVAKADDRKIVNGTSDWTVWDTPTTATETTRVVRVSVELPVEAGNEYQEGTADISFQIFAVQGNGTELLVPSADVLAEPETINDILATAAPGSVIALGKGTYGSIKLTQNDLTLVSTGATVGYLNFNAKDNCKISGITFDAAGAQMTYTNHNKQQTGFYANVTGAEINNFSASGIVIENCKFTGTPVAGRSYASIVFSERSRTSETTPLNATITGCTFDAPATYYIYGYYMNKGNNVITNNTFGSEVKTPIAAFSCHSASFTISDNIFNNWTNCAIAASKSSGTPVWKIENNAIYADNGDYFVDVTGMNLTVANNTVWDGIGEIVDLSGTNTEYTVKLDTPDVELFRVTNDAELAAALATVKSNSEYWNTPVVITLAANTYSGNHAIDQYPEWNGTPGKGDSGNNLAGLTGNENVTNITLVGEDGVVFNGNLTVNGFGNSDNGFTKATKATTTVKNIAFEGANQIDDEGDNKIAFSILAAANNVTVEDCTFRNATHVTVGGGFPNTVGTVSFKRCFFNNGNCISGYAKELNVIDCEAIRAYNGFINIQNSSKITVINSDIEGGKYFLRTNGSNVNVEVTNSTITLSDVGEGATLVVFRGSAHNVTFTGCALTYAVENTGTGNITIN